VDVKAVSLFFALLTVGADLFVLAVWGLRGLASVSPRFIEPAARFRMAFAPSAIWFAWIVAMVATLGSLYMSEIAKFTPCTLCWYQRIGMYPLVVILGIAAVRDDFGIRRYVVPLVLAASFISIYHYQLERFPTQGHVACLAEAPCTVVWIWKFHFISIPFMAMSGFLLIATLLTLPMRAPVEVPVEPERAREEVHV